MEGDIEGGVRNEIIHIAATEGLRATFEKSPKGSERASPADVGGHIPGKGN